LESEDAQWHCPDRLDPESGLFGGGNHPTAAIAAASVLVDADRRFAPGRTAAELRRRRRIGDARVYDKDGWSGRWSRSGFCTRCLGGCDDAADIIVFTSNDDRLAAVGALQAQNSAVLDAAPSDCDDDQEDPKTQDERDET
jgi:hypothetical protein